MKLSNEARELSSRMLMKPGARSDELELIFCWAGEMSVTREESSVSLATMADAFGRANYLDAETLGHADGYAWADEANRNHPTVFDLNCVTKIAVGLNQTVLKGQYLEGWRRGVNGFEAALRRGRAIGKRVA